MSGRAVVRRKGGPGSGHHSHVGRPGKVGGSLPDGSGTQTKRSPENDVHSHVDRLSDRFGIKPNNVTVTDNIEAEAAERGYSSGIGPSTKGFYDPDTEDIIINSNYLDNPDFGYPPGGHVRNLAELGWEFLVTHEYGHVLDVALGELATQPEWEKIADDYNERHEKYLDYKLDGNLDMYMKNGSVISGYSLNGLGYSKYLESWAEAFAAYVHRTDWLRSKNPDMYQYFKNVEASL